MTLFCEKMGCTFLVMRYRLCSLASAAIYKSRRVLLNILSNLIKVCLLATRHSQIIPFSSSFFNHGRQTCHFVLENILVLDSDFSYSFDWSQVAFGAFSFFFSSTALETQEICFHIFIFSTWSVNGRTCNDQKAGKVRKKKFACNVVEDYFSNKKFYLNTLNFKETQKKHLLYIWRRFFLLINLREIPAVCEQTCLYLSTWSPMARWWPAVLLCTSRCVILLEGSHIV